MTNIGKQRPTTYCVKLTYEIYTHGPTGLGDKRVIHNDSSGVGGITLEEAKAIVAAARAGGHDKFRELTCQTSAEG